MKTLKALLKPTAVIFGLCIAFLTMAIAAPQVAYVLSSLLILVALVALVKPIPRFGLGHRGFATALVLAVGIPGMTGANQQIMANTEERLASLKASDTKAYLGELQEIDEGRWLEELARIDPERHRVQVALLADQRAKAAEAAANERYERACGERNLAEAYVMSQSYVTAQLKAPSTAQYPLINRVRVTPMEDCHFAISAYVDAENSFGAMLRTRYSATMKHNPETGSWVPTQLTIAN